MSVPLDMSTDETVPVRYRRNIGTIGVDGQIRLLGAKVAIIGAGGLGGLVIELLARMGIGELVIVDGDVFCSHNLNRQILATEAHIGMRKAEVAAERIKQINSGVRVRAYPVMLTPDNAEELLSGVQVVVDALDNIPTRLLLANVCRRQGIPVVHAAIAGFTGQITTVFPGDRGLEHLYQNAAGAEKGIEQQLGNPAATPAMAAAMQAQEVVKILTGVGQTLRGKLLYFDAEQNLYELFELS